MTTWASIDEQLFAGASRHAGAIAVAGIEDMTYGELAERAQAVASYLESRGYAEETRIGICTGRSLEWVVAMFGVLRAGCAFVPFDPGYPLARLNHMLEAADVRCILVDSAGKPKMSAARCPVIDLGEINRAAERFEAPATDPRSLAYVVFTSGSGGRPKGVAIEHRSIANTTAAAIERYGISSRDRVLQFASTSFDTAFEEVFPCLCAGGTLVLRDDDMLQSPQVFLSAVAEKRVTVLDLPPAYWHELVVGAISDFRACRDLRLVILGGDRISPSDVKWWFENLGNSPALMTSYGPTETTVIVTAGPMADAADEYGRLRSEMPIGDAIPNVWLGLLDQSLNHVDPATIGQICIAGANLARGYHDQPAETAARFRPNPFGEPGSRLYLTGDLGRWSDKGQIEIVGRDDRQVKIRGFRVELTEIERTLVGVPGISQAAVVLRDEESSRHPRLLAYCVPDSDSQTAPADVIAAVRKHLPPYMVPSAVSFLDRFPLTPHGKIDRSALPSQDVVTGARPVIEDQGCSQLEGQLLSIWRQVLGVDEIGRNDNFFEIGGHSLVAMDFIASARSELGIEIPLIQVFVTPTVAELAEFVDSVILA